MFRFRDHRETTVFILSTQKMIIEMFAVMTPMEVSSKVGARCISQIDNTVTR